jgi:hypothetical protein
MQVTVRALPAQGHEFRRRAGRAWGKSPVVVTVVDEPKPHTLDKSGNVVEFSDEISPAQYAQLLDDPNHISVVPVGGGDPQNLDLRGKLQIAESELAKARAQLAELQERQDVDGFERIAEQKKNAAALADANEMIAALRAQFADRRPKAAK